MISNKWHFYWDFGHFHSSLMDFSGTFTVCRVWLNVDSGLVSGSVSL